MVLKLSRPIGGAALGAAIFPALLATSALGQIPGTPYGAGAPTVPQFQPALAGVTVPGFTYGGLIGAAEAYTTNVTGDANSLGTQNDFDTREILQLNALEHSAELTAALSYSGQFDEFARTNTAPVVSTFVTAYADYRAIPNYLRFDVRAYAQPILFNNLGPVIAPGTPLPQGFNANTSDVYSWVGSATFDFRFGSFAKSELTPSYGTVYFVEPAGAPVVPPVIQATLPPPEESTFSVVETITSGDDFSRLYWQLQGSDLEQSQAALGLKQRQGIATFDYAVTREVILLLTGGYEAFDSNVILTQDLTGPTGYGGVRLKLSNVSSIQVLAGEQYHRPSYVGDATIAFSPLTSFIAHFDDFIETPAGRLLGNVSGLNINVQGNGGFQFFNNGFVIPGQPPSALSSFSPISPDNLAFINVIQRFRDGEAMLAHKLSDTTQVSLVGFGTIADVLSTVPLGFSARQTSWGVTLQGTENLSPQLSVYANATYGNQNISVGGNNYISAAAGGSYLLSPTLSVYLQVADYSRFSSPSLAASAPASGSANVATITIGVSKSF